MTEARKKSETKILKLIHKPLSFNVTVKKNTISDLGATVSASIKQLNTPWSAEF